MLADVSTEPLISDLVYPLWMDWGSYLAREENGLFSTQTGDGILESFGVVCFVDVVESVQHVASDARGFVSMWTDLRAGISTILESHDASRIVRSTGDGLILSFNEPDQAIPACLAILDLVKARSLGMDPAFKLTLRIGIAAGPVFSDTFDVYGDTVNTSSRLASLALPQTLAMTSDNFFSWKAGSQIAHTDMGLCYLKHISKPVHVFLLRPEAGAPEASVANKAGHMQPPASIRPTVALVPPVNQDPESENNFLGDTIADELIRGLSATPLLNIVSRLSSTIFTKNAHLVAEISKILDADFIITGSYSTQGNQTRLSVRIQDAKKNSIVAQEEIFFETGFLFRKDILIFEPFIGAVHRGILRTGIDKLRRYALPNLESSALLFGAIALMHRPRREEFIKAHEALEELCHRHPREAQPLSWLACWHTINVQQGFSDDPRKDGDLARAAALRAVELDPQESLALSILGLVETNFMHNFPEAERLLDEAILINPNDTSALLHKAALLQFTDRGAEGYGLSIRARKLSPCDPHGYYFDTIAASCAFSAHDYEKALALANKAHTANRSYASSARVRTASLWMLGRHEEARKAAARLLDIEPGLTIAGWLERSPASDFDVGYRFSQAMLKAGVPARVTI